MASIRERRLTNGEKRFDVRYRPYPHAREVCESFRRKSDALKRKSEVEVDLARGVWRDPAHARVTVEEHSRRWLEAVEPTLAPKTAVQYELLNRLHILPPLGKMPMAQIRRIEIEEWLADLQKKGLGSSAIRQSRFVLSAILSNAVASGIIASSPMLGVKLRKPIPPHRDPLTVQEIEHLAAAMRKPYDLLVLLLAYGGLRISEGFALQRRHYDEIHGRLVVDEGVVEVHGRLSRGPTKNRTRRVVPLPRSISDALRIHVAQRVAPNADGPLFVSPMGKPLRYSNFRRNLWDPAVKKAGLPTNVTPHLLRHTMASLAGALGADPTAAAEVLGHDPAILARVYRHNYSGATDSVAELLETARTASLEANTRSHRFEPG